VRHFAAELEELNQKLLQMAGMAESAIHRSVQALLERNRELAEDVLRDEPKINRMELELDGLVTRLLALRQPVARDLRLLTAALKINVDLERIGDMAKHIAERSILLLRHPPVQLNDIPKIATLVESMLLNSLAAFVKRDADLAHSVLLADAEVDCLRDAVYADLLETMQRDPGLVSAAIDLIFIARNLERIGDHSTNIAEDVIFWIKGVDVRHHSKLAEDV
jgi:phosphate transport system protein